METIKIYSHSTAFMNCQPLGLREENENNKENQMQGGKKVTCFNFFTLSIKTEKAF